MRVADVGGDFLALHHPLTALGERFLLARLDREPRQFLVGVTREIGRRLALRDFARARSPSPLRPREAWRTPRASPGPAPQPAIGVDQRAVGRRVEQRAFVVLAVDFDQVGRERAQGLGADALIVDEGAGAAVGELHAPQDQFALRGDRLRLASAFSDGMAGGRSNIAVTWPCAWPWRTSAPSPRAPSASDSASSRIDLPAPVSPVRIVNPRREFEIQLIDQHDVADRKPGEHGPRLRLVRTERRHGRAWKSRIPDVPAARGRRSSAARRRPCTTGHRGSCGRAPPPRSPPRR